MVQIHSPLSIKNVFERLAENFFQKVVLRLVVRRYGALYDPGIADKNEIFSRLGKLMSKADSFDPLPGDDEEVVIQEDVYQGVWAEAEELRRSGELLKIIKQVRCPVLAIHGDYDPHPAEGVEKSLRQAVKDFRFILLKGCGHEPWKERRARDEFYSILKEELR
jgi:pimeloyl-ACP methyl ester carboxylesterase